MRRRRKDVGLRLAGWGRKAAELLTHLWWQKICRREKIWSRVLIDNEPLQGNLAHASNKESIIPFKRDMKSLEIKNKISWQQQYYQIY